MGLTDISYSVIPTIQTRAPERVVEPLDALVDRLLTHAITEKKSSASLYSFCLFSGITRRTADAETVEAIVLDYDNTVVRRADGPTLGNVTKTQQRIDNPVTPQQVEMLLRSQNIHAVIATSHTHTPEWPKFRVIVFVNESIPASVYPSVVGEFLAFSGLASAPFLAGLDRSCVQAARFYYFPSCAVETRAAAYAAYIPGEDYIPGEAVCSAAALSETPAVPRPSGRTYEWAPEQIARYFDRMFPHLAPRVRAAQAGGGGDVRLPCPIHDGDGSNFTFHTSTGLWKCFSQCPEMGITGGGLYSLHYHYRRLHGVPDAAYRDTRVEVDAYAGAPRVHEVSAPQVAASITAFAPSLPAPPMFVDDDSAPPAPDSFLNRKGAPAAYVQSLEAGAEERAARIFDEFKTRINTVKHDLDQSGTYIRQLTGHGDRQTVRRVPISPQPIWISRAGFDYTTKLKWYKIHYRDGAGSESTVWTKLDDLNKQDFTKLKNLGVTSKHKMDVAEYFNDSTHAFDEAHDFVPVTESFGWQPLTVPNLGSPAALVLYSGDADTSTCPMTVVAPAMLTATGDRAVWSQLLQDMVNEPFADFCVAWAFLGLSAASPLVSRLQMRNPLLMSAYRTSAGKSTLANLALALWSNPAGSTLPADTTNKGAEDLTLKRPEVPILVEEFQRIAKDQPTAANRFLYAMANGQRRVVSGRDLQHRGGEIRKGAVMLVAEDDLSSQFQQGASVRVLVLTERPLPAVAGAMWSRRMKAVADNHYGALGATLERAYTQCLNIYLSEHQALYEQVRAYDAPFDGDDVNLIALIGAGLQLLGRLVKVKLPVQATIEYLVDTVRKTRTPDRENVGAQDQVFAELIMTIMQSDWVAMDGTTDVAYIPNRGPIAVRGRQLMHPDVSEMEIFLNSPVFTDILRRRQIVNPNKLAEDWLQKGYLAANPSRANTRARWKRKNVNGMSRNDFKHEDAYVYLITPYGMSFVDQN